MIGVVPGDGFADVVEVHPELLRKPGLVLAPPGDEAADAPSVHEAVVAEAGCLDHLAAAEHGMVLNVLYENRGMVQRLTS